MTWGRDNAPRRAYLDWLRGIAVLLMIEVHLLDSWTGPPHRDSSLFGQAMILGGMGTALFLLLAGVAVALSAGSRLRRSGDSAAASAAVVRRGLVIFALAFIFRLQAWLLEWSSNATDLLKVDILNIMGPSIVCAAVLWRLAETPAARSLVLAVAGVATAMLTPVVRGTSLAGFLPDPIEAYFVPVPGLSNFVFFPWMGLVFAGASLGVLIDDATSAARERQLNIRLSVAGAALAGVAYACSFLPSERAHFWTSSPSYFFLRVGLLMAAIATAYAWNRAFVRSGDWSPLVQLGKTSLFIYWIHVELVYGLISRPWHHALTLGQAATAYVLFSGLMLACSIAKDRLTTDPGRVLRPTQTVAE
jgi:uncharacterized membrane protein